MKILQLGLIVTTAATILVGCTESTQQKGTTTTPDTVAVSKDTLSNFYGTYTGTLPAADCEGIKTTLTLNEDTTYKLISEYLGKDTTPFETNGVYHLLKDSLVELVTPSSGKLTYYKIQNGAVVLSDSLGTVSDGELADLYVLKKK